MSKMGEHYAELELEGNWKEGDNPVPGPCVKCRGKGTKMKRLKSMGRMGARRGISTTRTLVRCNKCKGTGYGE